MPVTRPSVREKVGVRQERDEHHDGDGEHAERPLRAGRHYRAPLTLTRPSHACHLCAAPSGSSSQHAPFPMSLRRHSRRPETASTGRGSRRVRRVADIAARHRGSQACRRGARGRRPLRRGPAERSSLGARAKTDLPPSRRSPPTDPRSDRLRRDLDPMARRRGSRSALSWLGPECRTAEPQFTKWRGSALDAALHDRASIVVTTAKRRLSHTTRSEGCS